MHGLSKKQMRVLQYIEDSIRTTGIPPSRAEITKALSLSSPNAAGQYLQALANKGIIDLRPATSRGIRVLAAAAPYLQPLQSREAGLAETVAEILRLPVVGRVAAGQPILAQEHIEAYHSVDAGLFRPQADFLLRVLGMSMRDAGILDKDLLAVSKTKEMPHRNQIVIARLGDDEVTVKYFQRHAGEIVWLLPANSDYEPIKVDLHHRKLSIEGLAVGVIRNTLAELRGD